MGRKLAVAVGATLIAAFSPAIAQAASVGGVDNATTRTITYDAAMGEVNQPTITREGANVVVRDPAVTLGFTGVCAQGADTHTVVCPEGAPAITVVNVVVNLLDGNDSATVNVANATINGGAGKDSLTGSPFRDVIDGQNDEDTVHGGDGNDAIVDSIDDGAPNHLFGGPGDDSITGSSGNDDLLGEAGNDSLVGDFGSDLLDGGDGFDTTSYGDRGTDAASGVAVTLANGRATGAGAPGENDTLANIEDLAGTGRNDTLVGDAGPNVIQGLDGDDSINGGPGGDILYGNQGNDSIDAVDGGVDRVACGGEASDAASADNVDQVSGCAGLSTAPVPVAIGPDQAAPRVGVTYTKVVKVRTFRRRGATFTVFSSDKAVRNTVTAQLIGRVRSVKSFSTAAVGELELARRSAGFVGKKRLTLKPSRRYRAHLRKGQRIRLRLTVTDQARNRATKTVIIRLK